MKVCKHGELTVLVVSIHGMYSQLFCNVNFIFLAAVLQLCSKQQCLNTCGIVKSWHCQTALPCVTTIITQVHVIVHVFKLSKCINSVNVFNCINCSTQYLNKFFYFNSSISPFQNSSTRIFLGKANNFFWLQAFIDIPCSCY